MEINALSTLLPAKHVSKFQTKAIQTEISSKWMIEIGPEHSACINLRLSQVHLSKNSSAIFSTTSLALPRLQLHLELQHSQEPISKDMIHHDTPAGAKPKKETNLVQMFANFKLLLCLFMLIDLAKVDYQPAYFLAARRWVQRLGIIGVVGQKLCMFWTWRCLRSWMKASLNQNGCASDSKIGRV